MFIGRIRAVQTPQKSQTRQKTQMPQEPQKASAPLSEVIR